MHVPKRKEMLTWWGALKRNPYYPTEAQWPIHEDPYRFKLVAGGERGGKSRTAAMFVLPRILDASLVWFVAKDYQQTRGEFEYLLDALTELDLVAQYTLPQSQYQPASLETHTGCRVECKTAADEQKLGMVAPDIIVGCEAAQLNYSVYLRLSARLAEKRGLLLLEGTFEEAQDWYSELWDAWKNGTKDSQKSYSLPSWSNTFIFPRGEDDPEMVRLRGEMSENRFMARHGGVPVPPTTAVFPEFAYDRHVGSYPFNPDLPVELAIDPGYAGAYAVEVIQRDNQNVYIVDEVYRKGQGAREVIRECRNRPWWENVEPRMAGTIDIAGWHHHGSDSQVEIWGSHPAYGGAGVRLRGRYIPIEDGIERYRTFLVNPATSQPRLFFNADTTPDVQKEHKRYRYPEDKEGKAVREKPVDRDNHGIKAITYWLCNLYGYTPRDSKTIRPYTVKVSVTDNDKTPYPGPEVRGHKRRRPRPTRPLRFVSPRRHH